MRLITPLALSVLILFAGCAPDLEKIRKVTEGEEVAVEIGKDVEIFFSEQGQTRAQILAPELLRYDSEEPYTEFGAGLRLYFYNSSLEIESKLSANFGAYFPKKEQMNVRDNVVLINVEGEKLNTEELTWDRKEAKIFTDKFVEITTPTEIIYGTGLEANQDFTDYTIKNISGVVNVEQE